MDVTILCKVIIAMCFVLSIVAMIGCVILILIGDQIDRIMCPVAIVILIIVAFVTWKCLVS